VDAILAQHGARHIVVGHTPTSGVIWPQYDGKVVMIDTGISGAYGGHVAYLEITPQGLFAGYPGGKLPLPSAGGDVAAYLEQVIGMAPDNRQLQQRLARLRAPATAPEPVPAGDAAVEQAVDQAADQAATPPQAVVVPICGSSQ
jgi:hypothetical protein